MYVKSLLAGAKKEELEKVDDWMKDMHSNVDEKSQSLS